MCPGLPLYLFLIIVPSAPPLPFFVLYLFLFLSRLALLFLVLSWLYFIWTGTLVPGIGLRKAPRRQTFVPFLYCFLLIIPSNRSRSLLSNVFSWTKRKAVISMLPPPHSSSSSFPYTCKYEVTDKRACLTRYNKRSRNSVSAQAEPRWCNQFRPQLLRVNGRPTRGQLIREKENKLNERERTRPN